MKKLNNFKWLFLGIVLCAVLSTMVFPVMAANFSKTAELFYNNIKITLNGKTLTPKDSSGNTVEPFIIDGTTYLPVRAVSNALGLNVDWDGNTNTVLLTSPNASPAGSVIFNRDGLKISYLGIGKMRNGGEEVKLFVENPTNKVYTVQVRDVSVNDVMTGSIFSCDVAAGKSAYDSIKFYDYHLEKSNITSVSKAEFYFHIFESNDWEKEINSPIISVTK